MTKRVASTLINGVALAAVLLGPCRVTAAVPAPVTQATPQSNTTQVRQAWGDLAGLSGAEWEGEDSRHRFVWNPTTQTVVWQKRHPSESAWHDYFTFNSIANGGEARVGGLRARLTVGIDGAASLRTREMIPLTITFRREGDGFRMTYNPFGQSFLLTRVANGWTGASPADERTPSTPSAPILVAGSVARNTQSAPASDTAGSDERATPSSGPIVLAAAPPPAAAIRRVPPTDGRAATSAAAPSSREALMQAQVAARREQAAREAELERQRQAQLEQDRLYAEQQRRAEAANRSSAFGDFLALGGAILGGVAVGMQTGGDMESISAGMALGSSIASPDSEYTEAAQSVYQEQHAQAEEQRAFEAQVIAELHNPDNPLTQQAAARDAKREADHRAELARIEAEHRQATEDAAADALFQQRLAAQNRADQDAADQQAAEDASAETERRRREQADRDAREARLAEDERLKQEADARAARIEADRIQRERVAAAERQRVADAEAERNRLIDWKEGVTLCSLTGPQAQFNNWTCEGPLQMNYVNFERSNAAAMMAQTGCTNYRELPRAGQYRAFGCGYGVHPTNPGALRNVPEMLGVYVDGRAVFRCRRSSGSDSCTTR